MNQLIATAILFGQSGADRFRDMGSGLRGEGARVGYTELFALAAVLLLVIGFVVVLARVLAKQDRRAKYNSPTALFRSLCQAHHLRRGERRLLKQMALDHKLVHPALVFLEPAWFEPASLSPNLRGKAPQVAAIAERIFAEPAADPAAEKEDAALDAMIDA